MSQPPSNTIEQLYILPSKVTPPSEDGLITRDRITTFFNDISHKKVVHITAPAGYGKSCVALQLCRAANMPFAWYRITESDNDIRQFSAYLVAALKPYLLTDSLCQTMALSGQVKQLPPFITQLVAELSLVTSSVLIVLDDCHTLHNENIMVALQMFLSLLPDNFHVLLVGRERLAVSLGRLYMENKVRELSSDDFVFDDVASEALIKQKFKLTLSETALKQMITKAGGWVAGLQLMALAASQNQTMDAYRHASNETQTQNLLFHYLADEILAQLPVNVRKFLMLSSVLEHFDVQLAQRVTGIVEAESILTYLMEQRLFIEAIGDGPIYYRYHSLFSDFLQHQLHNTYPDKVYALQSEAAMWWLKRGNYQLAVDYANKSKSVSAWESILDIAGWTFYRQGACALIQNGMMHLSLETISNNATLSILNALTRLHAHAAEVEQQLNLARPKLEKQLTPAQFTAYIGAISLVKAQQALSKGDSARAMEYAKGSLEKLDDTYRILMPMAKSALAEAYFAQGEKHKAQALWLDVLDDASLNRNYQLVLWAYHHLSTVDVMESELHHAFANQTRAMDYADSYCLGLNHGLWCIIRGRAEIQCMWMDIEQARVYIDKAGQFIEEWLNFGIICGQGEQEWLPVDTLKCRVARITNCKKDQQKLAAKLSNLLIKGGYHAFVRTQAEQEVIWAWIQTKQYAQLSSWRSLQPAFTSALNGIEQTHGRNMYRVARALGDKVAAKAILIILVDDANRADLKLDAGLNAILVAQQAILENKRVEAVQQWLRPAVQRLALSDVYLPFVEVSEDLLPCYEQLLHDTMLKDTVSQAFLVRLIEKCKQDLSEDNVPEPLYVLGITHKEWQILKCLQHGDSNYSIAETLFMAVGTVKNLLTKIYQKLGVKNRKQALAWLNKY